MQARRRMQDFISKKERKMKMIIFLGEARRVKIILRIGLIRITMTSLDTRTTENHTFWAKNLNMDFKMITSRRNYQGSASLTSLRASWIWAGARATRASYFDRILRGDANRMSECYRQYLTWSRVTQNRLINLFNINIHIPEKYLAKLENSILLFNNV